MGRDARVDARRGSTTDARRGRVGSRLSVCVWSRGIVDGRCVITRCNECRLSSRLLKCNSYGYTVCIYIQTTHQPRGASPSAVDADVRRRDARGARFERTPNARAFVRSFVRSFVRNVVDETTEARRERRIDTNGEDERAITSMMASVATSTRVASRRRSRACLLYTSPSPRDLSTSRMPSSA